MSTAKVFRFPLTLRQGRDSRFLVSLEKKFRLASKNASIGSDFVLSKDNQNELDYYVILNPTSDSAYIELLANLEGLDFEDTGILVTDDEGKMYVAEDGREPVEVVRVGNHTDCLNFSRVPYGLLLERTRYQF